MWDLLIYILQDTKTGYAFMTVSAGIEGKPLKLAVLPLSSQLAQVLSQVVKAPVYLHLQSLNLLTWQLVRYFITGASNS